MCLSPFQLFYGEKIQWSTFSQWKFFIWFGSQLSCNSFTAYFLLEQICFWWGLSSHFQALSWNNSIQLILCFAIIWLIYCKEFYELYCFHISKHTAIILSCQLFSSNVCHWFDNFIQVLIKSEGIPNAIHPLILKVVQVYIIWSLWALTIIPFVVPVIKKTDLTLSEVILLIEIGNLQFFYDP